MTPYGQFRSHQSNISFKAENRSMLLLHTIYFTVNTLIKYQVRIFSLFASLKTWISHQIILKVKGIERR